MVVGDLPATGLASGFSHQGFAGCHWCYTEADNTDLVRMTWGKFRRELADNHLFRTSNLFDMIEKGEPSVNRTHVACVRAGILSDTLRGRMGAAHRKKTGIDTFCCLSLLNLFSIVWDFMPDMMHIIKGLFQSHLIPMLKGERDVSIIKVPKAAEDRAEWKTANASKKTKMLADQALRVQAMELKIAGREQALRVLDRFTLSTQAQNVADKRSGALAGITGFVPNRMAIMKRTGSLKAVDWKCAVDSGALDYILKGLIPEPHIRGVNSLIDCLRLLLRATSDAPSNLEGEADEEEECQIMKQKVIEHLCIVERYLPGTELCSVLHELIHVPDCVFKWNSVRNFWAFFNERYIYDRYYIFNIHRSRSAQNLCDRFVGWIKNFIHSRKLPNENLVLGYTTVTLVRATDPAIRTRLLSRNDVFWQQTKTKSSLSSNFLRDIRLMISKI